MLWGSMLGMIALLFIPLMQGLNPGDLVIWLIVQALLLMMTGFIAWIWFATGYTLSETELFIRMGPFRWRVLLQEIRKVRRTRDPLSGPALSMDRLSIYSRRRGIITISPVDQERFLDLLRQYCPAADIPERITR